MPGGWAWVWARVWVWACGVAWLAGTCSAGWPGCPASRARSYVVSLAGDAPEGRVEGWPRRQTQGWGVLLQRDTYCQDSSLAMGSTVAHCPPCLLTHSSTATSGGAISAGLRSVLDQPSASADRLQEARQAAAAALELLAQWELTAGRVLADAVDASQAGSDRRAAVAILREGVARASQQAADFATLRRAPLTARVAGLTVGSIVAPHWSLPWPLETSGILVRTTRHGASLKSDSSETVVAVIEECCESALSLQAARAQAQGAIAMVRTCSKESQGRTTCPQLDRDSPRPVLPVGNFAQAIGIHLDTALRLHQGRAPITISVQWGDETSLPRVVAAEFVRAVHDADAAGTTSTLTSAPKLSSFTYHEKVKFKELALQLNPVRLCCTAVPMHHILTFQDLVQRHFAVTASALPTSISERVNECPDPEAQFRRKLHCNFFVKDTDRHNCQALYRMHIYVRDGLHIGYAQPHPRSLSWGMRGRYKLVLRDPLNKDAAAGAILVVKQYIRHDGAFPSIATAVQEALTSKAVGLLLHGEGAPNLADLLDAARKSNASLHAMPVATFYSSIGVHLESILQQDMRESKISYGCFYSESKSLSVPVGEFANDHLNNSSSINSAAIAVVKVQKSHQLSRYFPFGNLVGTDLPLIDAEHIDESFELEIIRSGEGHAIQQYPNQTLYRHVLAGREKLLITTPAGAWHLTKAVMDNNKNRSTVPAALFWFEVTAPAELQRQHRRGWYVELEAGAAVWVPEGFGVTSVAVEPTIVANQRLGALERNYVALASDKD